MIICLSDVKIDNVRPIEMNDTELPLFLENAKETDSPDIDNSSIGEMGLVGINLQTVLNFSK